MRQTTTLTTRKSTHRLTLLLACSFFLGSATYAQSGGSPNSCVATRLRLRLATSNDDLRGGKDNLNIIVFFTNGTTQAAANVNKSQNWPNNSVNYVDIFLNQPVPPSEIRALRLIHIADGGFQVNLPELATLAAPFDIAQGFLSPDNWDMADLQVSVLGNGVGARIASHGYFRFTGSNPVLTVGTQVPANVCGSGRPAGNSGGGSGSLGSLNPALNPGGSGLHPVASGSRYGALTNQDVIRMAGAGVPESAIISSIQSSPGKFDLTPAGRTVLQRAGVSQKVQDAMLTRMSSGTGKNADDLNPQPYPPKGTLLSPGGQQTMLGGNSPSSTTGTTMLNGGTMQGTSANPGNAAITDGTFQGGIRPSAAPQVGVGQTMSATTASSSNTMMLAPRTITTTPATSQSVNSLATIGRAPSQVNLQVSAECAKDPSYRILGVSSATFTLGPHYTLWGCAFGTQPNVKAPMPAGSTSRNRALSANKEYAQILVSASGYKGAWFVKCNIQSWTDNAIIVTIDPATAVYPGTGPSPIGQDLPSELWLTRSGGTTTIWGHEGGFSFKPTS